MKEKVMCKYCKNCELMTCNNQTFCNRFGGYVSKDDFCSRGEPNKNKIVHPTEKGGGNNAQ